MVDNFSLALAHVLLAIMVWRLLASDALDHEPPPGREEPHGDA